MGGSSPERGDFPDADDLDEPGQSAPNGDAQDEADYASEGGPKTPQDR